MSTSALLRTDTADNLAGGLIALDTRHMLWITWDVHRRSAELARAIGVPLREITSRGPRPIRHSLGILRTVATMVWNRPRLVFVQNPSIVLAALACALRRLLGYRVVVDRHSNFRFEDTTTGIFNAISNYSLRSADLTIVTNAFVKDLVESKGGRAVILPDKIPTLCLARQRPLPGLVNVLFVCTFSPDEPVMAVIDAARQMDPRIHIYVSGNPLALAPDVRQSAPKNVIFTGFLPTDEYESLMASVDIVLELTTRDHTLLCGAYEAVSLGKPLVISRTKALTRHFHRGAVATNNRSEDIAEALTSASERLQHLRDEVAKLRKELDQQWEEGFAILLERIGALAFSARTPVGPSVSR